MIALEFATVQQWLWTVKLISTRVASCNSDATRILLRPFDQYTRRPLTFFPADLNILFTYIRITLITMLSDIYFAADMLQADAPGTSRQVAFRSKMRTPLELLFSLFILQPLLFELDHPVVILCFGVYDTRAAEPDQRDGWSWMGLGTQKKNLTAAQCTTQRVQQYKQKHGTEKQTNNNKHVIKSRYFRQFSE